jgi:sarcosine oxidase/L-pipecolate oxidase
MINVLFGKTNGEEKDQAWAWKSAEWLEKCKGKGKEFGSNGGKGRQRRELSEYEDGAVAKL